MIDYASLPLIEQCILTLAALILVCSFALLAQERIVATIQMFAWQGFLLACVTALVAIASEDSQLFVSASLTLVLKAGFIPWLLIRQSRNLGILKDKDAILRPGITLLAAGALVIFCYSVSRSIDSYTASITGNAVALSLAVVMLSMLMLITRGKAITQVIAFMAMENGLFFAAVTATHGMPLVVELGVAFDVLVASIIFGVFFFHIRDSIDSLNVNELSSLSEVDR